MHAILLKNYGDPCLNGPEYQVKEFMYIVIGIWNLLLDFESAWLFTWHRVGEVLKKLRTHGGGALAMYNVMYARLFILWKCVLAMS